MGPQAFFLIPPLLDKETLLPFNLLPRSLSSSFNGAEKMVAQQSQGQHFFFSLCLYPLLSLSLSHSLSLLSLQVVAAYLEKSRALMADQASLPTALSLLEAALALNPRSDAAMELKCRCLLRLRRYQEISDILQILISNPNSAKTSRCFPKKTKFPSQEWKYLLLGQARFNLGFLEEAILLLQKFRRDSAASSHKKSRHFAGDEMPSELSPSSAPAELISAKFLVRRRTAAVSAMNAGYFSESARQFSKILDCKRGIPLNFAVSCFIGRATANFAAARVADAISDCNQALALDPTSIPALNLRSDVYECAGFYSEALRDLDHLKLRMGLDRRGIGDLVGRIEKLRRSGGGEEDHYRLLGVRRGCSAAEAERAHRILALRNIADRAGHFVERLACEEEVRVSETARENAMMSAMILSRLLQKSLHFVLAEVEKAKEKESGKDEMAKAMEMAAAVLRGVFCRDLVVVGSLLSRVGFHRTIPLNREALAC